MNSLVLILALFVIGSFGAAVKPLFLCNMLGAHGGPVGTVGFTNCNSAPVVATLTNYDSTGAVRQSVNSPSLPVGFSFTSANSWVYYNFASLGSFPHTIQACYGGTCYNTTWTCDTSAQSCNPYGVGCAVTHPTVTNPPTC